MPADNSELRSRGILARAGSFRAPSFGSQSRLRQIGASEERMSKTVRGALTALMFTCVCANARAENAACANPQDMSAVRAAAVQQQLMVAALSCHAIDQYNK